MSRIKLVFSEAVRSLGANLSTTIAATMTVLIGMFLLGLFIALGTWVVSWSNHVKKELVVKVYMCTPTTCGHDRTVKEINAVRSKALSMHHVKSVEFIDKVTAFKKLQRQRPDLTKDLSGNPLPDAFNITPTRAEFVDEVAHAFEKPKPAGVEKVNYGKKRAHRVLRVAKVIESLFLAATIILLIASTLLIANTIRLSIFARRREIEVMKLVGATNWFVRGPFMLEGLLTGIVGSAAAIFLLIMGKVLVWPSILGHFDSGSAAHALPFMLTCLIILGTGLVIGAAGSGLTIRRFLQV
jgi:cell division transport system permease protein